MAEAIHREWRDSSWTGIQSVKDGLDKSTQEQRLTLFGPNVIDIEGKSTASLLVDEVSRRLCLRCILLERTIVGYTSVLRFSNRQHRAVVLRRLLLLCVLYCAHFCYQYHNNAG